MNCVITGCAIFDPAYPKWRWGDLYEEGDCYIHYSQRDWEHGYTPSLFKSVDLGDGFPIYDKGGTVVVEKFRCSLNGAAREYLHAPA